MQALNYPFWKSLYQMPKPSSNNHYQSPTTTTATRHRCSTINGQKLQTNRSGQLIINDLIRLSKGNSRPNYNG